MDLAALDFTFVTADFFGTAPAATMVNRWFFERAVNYSISLQYHSRRMQAAIASIQH
jgi:hypothetical protein